MTITVLLNTDPLALPEGMTALDLADLVGEAFQRIANRGLLGIHSGEPEDYHARAHAWLWDALNEVLGSDPRSPFAAIAGMRGSRVGPLNYELVVDWRWGPLSMMIGPDQVQFALSLSSAATAI